MITFHDVVPILQTAIGPMILISGFGLLLLTMTNRLGRIIDRSRALVHDLESHTESHIARINKEIAILLKRARYTRTAILLVCVACFGASLLILLLFLSALISLDLPLLLSVIFIITILSLSFSLLLLFFEVNMSLKALKIEIDSHHKKH